MSISEIKNNFLRKVLIIVAGIPILILALVISVLDALTYRLYIELTELPYHVGVAWRGLDKNGRRRK